MSGVSHRCEAGLIDKSLVFWALRRSDGGSLHGLGPIAGLFLPIHPMVAWRKLAHRYIFALAMLPFEPGLSWPAASSRNVFPEIRAGFPDLAVGG